VGGHLTLLAIDMEETKIEQSTQQVDIPDESVAVTNPIDRFVVEEQYSSFDELIASKESSTQPTNALPILETTPEIVALSSAALDFQKSPEEVATSLQSYTNPEEAIKDTAKGIVEGERSEIKKDAMDAATAGQRELVEIYTKAYADSATLSSRLSHYNALSIVATKAVENTATRHAPTVQNNSAEQLGKIAKEQGLTAAMAIQMEQKAKSMGMSSTALEAVGALGAAIGGVYAATKVSGPLGWAVGAGLTAMSLLDQGVIRDAIKKHAQLSVDEKWGITKHIDTYHKYLSTLPVDKALAISEKVVEDVLKNSDRLPVVGKVFAAGNAASLHTGAYSAPGLDISAQTRDVLDAVAVVGDGIGAFKYLKAIGSTAKSLDVAAGGSVVGEQLAKDITSGKNVFNVAPEQQIEWSLSSNFEQILPEGIRGSAGSAQKALMEETQRLLKSLDERIALGGDEDLSKVREFVSRNFEIAPTSVAKYDAATGELVLQHPTRAAPWTSAENAQKFADKLMKETGWKLEVRATNDGASFAAYDGVPDSLMGFPKSGAGKASADVKYKHYEYVKLTDPTTGEVVYDAIPGMNKAHALERANRNWKGMSVENVSAEQMAKLDPELVGQVASEKAGKALSSKAAPFQGEYSSALETFASDVKIGATIGEEYLLRDGLSIVAKGGKVVDKATGKPITDTTTQTLAQWMLDGKMFAKTKIKYVDYLDNKAGQYDPYTNTVFITDRHSTSPSLMVHEAFHARIGGVLEVALNGSKEMRDAAKLSNEQRAAAENLQTLFKFVKNKVPKVDVGDKKVSQYGSENVHEMVSELTNPVFRDALKNIPVTKEVLAEMKMSDISFGTKVRNMWDALVTLVAKTLGIEPNGSALDHILDQAGRLASSVSKQQENVIPMLKKGGFDEMDLAALFRDDGFAATTLSHGYYVHLAPSTKQVHNAEDIATRLGAGLDPKHQASMESMHERFVALLQEQRDKRLLAEFIQKNIGGLNRAEYARVEGALKKSDAARREFTDVDLFAHNVKSDKEKTAFYAYRTLEHLSLKVKNQHIIKDLTREGWMQGYIKFGGNVVHAPVMKVDAAPIKGEQAFDLATNKWSTVAGNETNLYRSRTSIDVGGGKEANLFLRTTDEVTVGMWRDQLPALPGSYRRIYTQDYFGQVGITRNVNGKDVPDVLNLRTSNSGKDMHRWASGMNTILKEVQTNPSAVTLDFVEKHVGMWENAADILASINKGEWSNYKQGSFTGHYDRETTNYITSLTKAASDAYDGDRNMRGMKLQSIDGMNNIMSPMDALGAELSNISRVRNVAEWRNKWVDVWWNTFKDTIDPKFVMGRRPLEVMTDKNFQTSMYTGGDNAAKFAESQRNYILSQLGGQTLDERYIESGLRRLTFNHFNKYVKLPFIDEPVHIGHAIRNFDPLQFARSFNFHTMLGAFNPAQLIVQSQAMLNVVAISPVHGMKAALSMPVIRVALMSDNPAVWKTLAKTSGMSSQEFESVVKSIRRSGLIDGIGATSLHNIEAGAFNMFSSWTGKVSEKSAMFFNRGEEASRITAFEAARREWMVANKGADFTTDTALASILARTDDMTQNMSRSNLAFYQRGVFSIPAQYLQYNIKLAANILGSFAQKGAGRGFTHAEAGRVMAAHLMAYGLAGNGMMMLYDEISGGYEQATGSKLSSEQKLAVVEGGLAWIANSVSKAVTGQELMLGLGSRLGSFNFYQDLVEAMVRGDTSWWQAALGASASIPKKIGSLRYLADPILVGDLSPEAWGSAINKVLKNTLSGWNNATKAIYAYNNGGKLASNQGIIIANMSPVGILAQGMGLPPAEVQDWYRYVEAERDMRKATKDFAKEYMRLDEIRVDLLRETGGVYNERINEYITAQASLIKAVPIGMMDEFDSEKEKLWDMRNSETGKPRLVEKYVELMDKGVKLKDVSRIKEYGMESK
jgi:hypothetical protein